MASSSSSKKLSLTFVVLLLAGEHDPYINLLLHSSLPVFL
jgi:hypothetical protein